MGKAIERLARARGHEVVLIVDENNRATCTDDQLKQADVAIEFTTPVMFRWCPARRVGWKDGTR